VHFVHSPSASGKTTFLKTGTPGQLTILRDGDNLELPNLLYEHGGNIGIVDGDDVIHYTIGWPPNKEWWKLRGATYVHAAQLFALVNSAVRIDAPPWMRHLVIMFNGGMKQLAVATKLYAVERGEPTQPVTLHHHTVIPSREDHERNIESRRLENLKEGRSWTFPKDWGDAHNNRVSVETMAETFGVLVHSNFDDVLKEISPDYSKQDKPKPTQRKRLIIFGGPLAGKTTAADKGLLVDVESDTILDHVNSETALLREKWTDLEDAWKMDRIQADRDKRNDAYTAFAISVMNNDIPILSTHFSDKLLEGALETGANLAAVVVGHDDMKERIKKVIAETDSEKALFRLQGTVGYLTNIAEHREIETFSSFEAAIAANS